MELLPEANMQTLATTSAFLLLVALCYLVVKPRLKRKKQNYPPIAGTIFHQLLNLHRLADSLTEISRRHKTFRVLTPSCNYIYTVNPVNVEYILKTNFANYGKGEYNHATMKDLLGDGIFAVDGDKWRHQRKIASYEFSAKVLRDYSSDVFKDNATRLAEILVEAANTNQMFEMQDLLMKSTMDSMFKVGFGVDLDTLSGTNTEGIIFARAFDESSCQLMRRYFDIFWKIKRFLNVGLEAKMKKNIKLMDDFVYKLIDMKIEEMSKKLDSSIKKEDILYRFLLQKEKDPENITHQYLRDIIVNFLLAGRDTTAGTLAWFFYMMCKHPDVQEKVANEVKEAINVKEKLHIKDFIATLTEEALNRMHYLHAALTETLRLYPAVPMDPKYCSSDDKLPDGFNVDKGDLVIYQPFCMGRMKFLWGEDAEMFRPERWLNQEGVFQPENPFKFAAFQAGPRICLGKEFAYLQMKIFAATILYLLKFELWDKRKPVNYKSMITLQIDGGLQLRALKRKKCSGA